VCDKERAGSGGDKKVQPKILAMMMSATRSSPTDHLDGYVLNTGSNRCVGKMNDFHCCIAQFSFVSILSSCLQGTID
jgi:hypothetical protein